MKATLGIALVTIVLTACAGPSGTPTPTAPTNVTRTPSTHLPPSPSPAASATPTPSPEEPQNRGLPPNTVGLYLGISLDSYSSVLKEVDVGVENPVMAAVGNIPIESSSGAIVLYVPESQTASVIHVYQSPSYASNVERPRTVDDQLFVATKWHGSKALDVTEYNPRTGEVVALQKSLGNAGESHFAILGEQAFYITQVTRPGQGTGSTLMRLDLRDGTETDLGDPGRVDRLFATQGAVYSISTPFTDNPFIEIHKLYPTPSRKPELVGQLAVEDMVSYIPGSFQSPAMDSGFAYWLGGRDNGQNVEVEVWRYKLADSQAQPELLASFTMQNVGITFLYGLDVDGHYVATLLEEEDGSRTSVLLYDGQRDLAQLLDTGLEIYDMAVLYLEE